MFIERTRTALDELMGRRLEDVRLAVMMLDGLEIAERTHVVALGISTEGVKIPPGLWEGSTENSTLARTLLPDLVDRGLDPVRAILFVIEEVRGRGHSPQSSIRPSQPIRPCPCVDMLSCCAPHVSWPLQVVGPVIPTTRTPAKKRASLALRSNAKLRTPPETDANTKSLNASGDRWSKATKELRAPNKSGGLV